MLREESFVEDVLLAVLMFHDATPWTLDKHAVWYQWTGKSEVTTKALCDTVREALCIKRGEAND